MPFRDKNQTVQIDRNEQGGMLLHRIRACNKSFSALIFPCLLLKKFYVEGDKENHEAFSTYLQLLLKANHLIFIMRITKKEKAIFSLIQSILIDTGKGFRIHLLNAVSSNQVQELFTTTYWPEHKMSN